VIGWFRRRLAPKLLLLIFLIAVVPYAAVLYYTYSSEERLYTEHFYKEHGERMRQVAASVKAHIEQLRRELTFLAGSVVMDDLLIDDLDRRVASLLERYKAIYDLDIELLALGTDGRVIASTDNTRTGSAYGRRAAFETARERPFPTAVDGKLVVVEVPVLAALEAKQTIGYLVMEYRLANLGRFNLTGGAATVLFDPGNGSSIGMSPPAGGVTGAEGMRESKRTVWFYRTLSPQLPGWYLGYRVDRAQQRHFIEGLNRVLVLLLIFGMGVIAFAAFWFSRRIVAPLGVLQRQASEMVRTRQYTLSVAVERSDEIGQLAASFAALARDIRNAFEALERENIFRMKRLTQMIDLFNRLMETEEESACLKAALDELKTLAPEYNVRFSRTAAEAGMPALVVYDFEHEMRKPYGVLLVPEELADEERAFFRAVASMIAARIDQIRAFNRLHRDAEAKTAFISHLSHDLRTPLHAILSQTQFLVGYGRLEAADLERVGGIEHAAQQLLKMVNDLLDLARLESGKYEPELETLSAAEVAETLDGVLTLLSPLAEAKALVLKRTGRIPALSVVADRRLLRQIMLNLLSNALKFTQRGGVTCRFEAKENGFCLEVADSGRGLTPQALREAFEPFVQGQGGDRGRGSGLGLALSRRFARLFGGELSLHSDGPGKGSTARLCFTTL